MMESGGIGFGIAQLLALENRLLREEKYIVQSLKAIRQEKNGFQIERMHMLSLLREVQSKGVSSTPSARVKGPDQSIVPNVAPPCDVKLPAQDSTAHKAQERYSGINLQKESTDIGQKSTPIQPEIVDDFRNIFDTFNHINSVPNHDSVANLDMQLDLTVPQHPFFGSEQEETEELEHDELEEMENDDFEIEMSMLMHGKHTSK